MSRYIDADAIEKDDGLVTVILGERYYHETILKNAPTAEVSEVKRGRWDDKKVAFYLKCSECGCCVRAFAGEVFLDYGQEWNYCPNCGAKMDLSADELLQMPPDDGSTIPKELWKRE